MAKEKKRIEMKIALGRKKDTRDRQKIPTADLKERGLKFLAISLFFLVVRMVVYRNFFFPRNLLLLSFDISIAIYFDKFVPSLMLALVKFYIW